jgi:spermidine synthase
VRLFLISIASLYFELLMIRWLPSEIRILAYFSNVTLISCILGLGLGALVGRNRLLHPASVLLLLVVLMVMAYLYHGLQIPLPFASENHFVWNGLSRAAKGTVGQYAALFAFFAVNTAFFIPIGQLLGEEFDRFSAIPAYLINVTGALAGLCLFALFSLLGISPVWWFIIGLLLLAPLLPWSRLLALHAGAVIALATLGSLGEKAQWSPYYMITTEAITILGAPTGYQVSVNEDSHQQALDLSGRYDGRGDLATRRRIYDEPYRHGPNRRVLVVGAGTGNDVAAALRAGAQHVDAVEIDPVILELGRRLHPERPYDDPRVQLWNREARSFVRSAGHYDKIVLGYVDSHSLFSAMSSVRLDNFVYTAEALREFKAHLTSDGVLAVTFTVHEQWIADRLYTLLSKAFGSPPLVFQGARSSSSGTVFLAGTPVQAHEPQYVAFDPREASDDGGHTWQYAPDAEGYLSPSVFHSAGIVPDDNWPYLYLRDRTVPVNYLVCMAGLLVFSVAVVKVGTGLGRIRWPFFLLGAAFLLVETKAMTELAIFFGSTWTVNFFVIAAILALIVLGTLLVLRAWAPSTTFAFTLLAVTLIATYLYPVRTLLEWDSPIRGFVALGLLCLPLFFAAMIFAREIQQEPRPSAALASNLLGALVGGVLEYSSMRLGFHVLYLLALALYLLAWLGFRRVQLARA